MGGERDIPLELRGLVGCEVHDAEDESSFAFGRGAAEIEWGQSRVVVEVEAFKVGPRYAQYVTCPLGPFSVDECFIGKHERVLLRLLGVHANRVCDAIRMLCAPLPLNLGPIPDAAIAPVTQALETQKTRAAYRVQSTLEDLVDGVLDACVLIDARSSTVEDHLYKSD